MKQNFFSSLALALTLICATVAPSLAQPNDHIPGHPRVNQVNARRDNQAGRIRNGVNNGSLTHREARGLRAEGRAIHSQERVMRAQNGGHLTRGDQRMLNREQNMRGRQIRRLKHN